MNDMDMTTEEEVTTSTEGEGSEEGMNPATEKNEEEDMADEGAEATEDTAE